MPIPERAKVNSRQEFIDLLFELLDHNDAVEWDNDSAYSFIQALAAWLNDAEGFYHNVGEPINPDDPTWQLFADALQGAICYE